MSKEIKFRGYVYNVVGEGLPHRGNYVYGDLVHGNNFDYIVGGVLESDNGDLTSNWWQLIKKGYAEQFTGLKDKNGKEIYEGDLLTIKYPHGNELGQVEWSDKEAGFIIAPTLWEITNKNLQKVVSKSKVTGNIHQGSTL